MGIIKISLVMTQPSSSTVEPGLVGFSSQCSGGSQQGCSGPRSLKGSLVGSLQTHGGSGGWRVLPHTDTHTQLASPAEENPDEGVLGVGYGGSKSRPCTDVRTSRRTRGSLYLIYLFKCKSLLCCPNWLPSHINPPASAS